ncbi:Adenosyl-chloride synthase [Candidatus Magnetaquicoccaceae bacterium FCR-1]|uniref:Adenosyl-chloride synthase n=1 Tax=Candidatus Magnetaquiglobus chichijimensis TaxID=3141448 RepID=A0ABQ0C515_9PROT
MPVFGSSSPPLPVILLTDFGVADPFVGQVKGVLMRLFPKVRFVDLFHDIPPFAIKSGAWMLERCLPHMPSPAIWLGIVDPGVGGGRRGLVVQSGGSYFIGPDNGLLTPILNRHDARVLSLDTLGDAETVSPTFHGRDLFAPAAAHLLQGRSVSDLGTPLIDPPMLLADPGWRKAGHGAWGTEVLFVDHYGNLVTALPGEELRKRPVKGWLDGIPCGGIVTTFASVPVGAPALVVGGFGTVEVVVNQGNAANHFKRGLGAEVMIRVEEG